MLMPFEITCVILCGGKSSRMGEDKSLLPFYKSSSLASYQYNRLKPYFKDIYISSKIDKFDFLNKNMLILDENKDIYSPIIALDTIFNQLANQKIFIITVDTPLVSIESIKKLIEGSKNFDICVAQTEKIHNLCGVFLTNISSSTNAMIKNDIHKVGYLLKNNNTHIIQFPNNEEFLNLNNKEEYIKAFNIIKKTYN